MSEPRAVNTKNLRMLAWKAGHHGVTGLAKSIGRSRVTVWKAVREPNRFRPTYRAVLGALRRTQ